MAAADRDNNFNLLRFVAASLVLMTHSFALSTGSGMAEPLRASLGVTWGSIAVDVFFVTSGYLVSASLVSRQRLVAFAAARFLRIYPGLWVMLTITVVACGLLVSTLPANSFFLHPETWKYIVKNGTMFKVSYYLPGVFDSNPWKRGVNGSLWTLPMEIKMYGFLALFWLLSRTLPANVPRAFARICTGVVILCLAGTLVIIVRDIKPAETPFYLAQYVTLGYMFFSGAVLRTLLQGNVRLSTLTATLLMLVVLVSAFDRLCFQIAYTLCLPYLVLYLALVPSGAIRQFNRCGDYSYGIYIYAFPVQQMLAFYWKGITPYEMLLSSFVVTILFAIASWHLVEKRALALKRRFETPSPNTRLQAANAG